MAYSTFFIDLDDTVYSRGSNLWPEIKKRIGDYMLNQMAMPADEVPLTRKRLVETYGTTLRGLKLEYGVDEHDFLRYVHDIDLKQYIAPDPDLAAMLKQYPQEKVIFTNADRSHAQRVIDHMGLQGIFSRIVDILDLWPSCKPHPEAYETAFRLSGKRPEECLFVDDTLANVQGGVITGMYSILVGDKNESCPFPCLASLHHLPELIDINGELLHPAGKP